MESIAIQYRSMRTSFKHPFAQYVNKANRPLQLAIEDKVEMICETPEIGELKARDLADVRAYKSRFNQQEYPIAYRSPARNIPIEFMIIDFYQIGTYENFYDKLKQYLRHDKNLRDESRSRI